MTDPLSQNDSIINESLIIKTKYRSSRHEHSFLSSSEPCNDGDLAKVIIPYNFEEKKYMILEQNIEFYDKKEYLIDKLSEYNSMDPFQIQNKFKPSFLHHIGMYLPCLIILVIFLYLGIIILALFSFNPILIYTFVVWGKHLYQLLKNTQSVFLDKFRINKIKTLLDEENIGMFCRRNNLQWQLGQSGYWLELEKLF